MNARGVTILFQTPAAPRVHASRTPSGRPDAVFSVPQPVTALTADGTRAAMCSAGRVVVWQEDRRTSASFASPSELDECRAPVLGDGQVAWIASWSGNTQEGQDLVVASLSGGKPRRIDGTERGRDQGCGGCPGGYVGELRGGGKLLAYNRWFCGKTDPDTGDCLQLGKQQLVRIVGGRRAVVRRGADAYALGAVGGGRMAVFSNGAVTVLAGNGSRVAKVAAVDGQATRAVALSKTRLAVQRTLALDLYDARGRRLKSLPLGHAAAFELVGLNDKVALLEERQQLVLLRLSDDKLISLRADRGALTDAGLFYVYNTPKAAMKVHILFEPTAKLLRRF